MMVLGARPAPLGCSQDFSVFRGNDFTSDEKRTIVLEMGKLGSSLSLLRSNIFISSNFSFNRNNITYFTGWLII